MKPATPPPGNTFSETTRPANPLLAGEEPAALHWNRLTGTHLTAADQHVSSSLARSLRFASRVWLRLRLRPHQSTRSLQVECGAIWQTLWRLIG
jgi:hypothetical protein